MNRISAAEPAFLERCVAAGRRAHTARVQRSDNPFNVLLLSPAPVGVPYEVWVERAKAWERGWDEAATRVETRPQ